MTSAAAAALGAEPIPASLEYRPRLMPHMMHEPVNPPKMALKLNAEPKIMPKTRGRLEICVITTKRDTRT